MFMRHPRRAAIGFGHKALWFGMNSRLQRGSDRIFAGRGDRDLAGMGDELMRAVLPRIPQGKFATGLARNPQRLHASGAQLGMQNADRMIPNDIAGPRHWKCRNWHAAGERLELHDAESVGQTWKNEDIGCSKVRGENAVVELAEKLGARKPALEFGLLRPSADDDFGARQIEREKCRQVLLDRHPAHRHENRSREVEIDGTIRTE